MRDRPTFFEYLLFTLICSSLHHEWVFDVADKEAS